MRTASFDWLSVLLTIYHRTRFPFPTRCIIQHLYIRENVRVIMIEIRELLKYRCETSHCITCFECPLKRFINHTLLLFQIHTLCYSLRFLQATANKATCKCRSPCTQEISRIILFRLWRRSLDFYRIWLFQFCFSSDFQNIIDYAIVQISLYFNPDNIILNKYIVWKIVIYFNHILHLLLIKTQYLLFKIFKIILINIYFKN